VPVVPLRSAKRRSRPGRQSDLERVRDGAPAGGLPGHGERRQARHGLDLQTQSLTPEAVPAWRYVWPIVRWFQRRRSPETAARVPAFVASSPEVSEVTGAYFNDRTAPARPKSHLLDGELQERVWALGEDLYARAPTAWPSHARRIDPVQQEVASAQVVYERPDGR